MVLSWDLDKRLIHKSALEQLPYVRNMADWEISNMIKALTSIRALNSLEEEGRLEAGRTVKSERRQKRKRVYKKRR